MFKNLERKQIEKVIKENIIARLGCHADRETYVVPISYAYDGEYLYARSFEGMKISMMRKNPKVCVRNNERYGRLEVRYNLGYIRGAFRRKRSEKAFKKLTSRILQEVSSDMVKFTEEWPFEPKDYNKVEGVVYRIHVTKKTGRLEMLDPELFRH